MTKPPKNGDDVLDLVAFRSSRGAFYEPSNVGVLEGLDAVRKRGFTIAGGDHFSPAQVDFFCQALASDSDLWVIEVTAKSGDKMKIYRGNLPPDKWPLRRF